MAKVRFVTDIDGEQVVLEEERTSLPLLETPITGADGKTYYVSDLDQAEDGAYLVYVYAAE